MTKILHFILGKANPERANGVNQVIYGLAKYQSLAGHTVCVLGISKSMKRESEIIDRSYYKVEAYQSFFFKGYKRFQELVKDIDIVHFHGVWNNYNIIAGKYLNKINKPYIITAHCGYSVDRLKQSNYWAKLLYHHLFQKRFYEKAAGIHALSREETTDILRYCQNKNIFVVPNGIDMELFNHAYSPKSNNKIKIGYLGRLSVEKNIDGLINSIALLPQNIKENIELSLIGPLDKFSVRYQHLVKKLELSDIIKFVGPIYGEQKFEYLEEMDFYIHPAHSDVISIAVIEVLAIGLPSVLTRTSHLSYYYDNDTFIMVEPTSYDLCRGILEMIDRKESWNSMSVNARALASSTFNWEKSAQLLIKEYNYITGKL